MTYTVLSTVGQLPKWTLPEEYAQAAYRVRIGANGHAFHADALNFALTYKRDFASAPCFHGFLRVNRIELL